MIHRFLISSLIAATCLITLSSCDNQDMFPDPTVDQPLAEAEQVSPLLATMPKPKEPIMVSVYEFGDQTGQFKPSATITDYSSAVTKGGLAVLIKALLDAGNHKWFTVAERGSVKDLLYERNIIHTMREQYSQPGAKIQELPALIYSGMILEGGIIFYDSNVMTGGAGARYFGIGGNTQYSRDLVTVYLRAVSTSTGEVLLSVTSSKTVYSIAVNGSVFRYLTLDRLLEAEGGYTVNEPGQLAIRRAIETAVYSLVMEGSEAGLWTFADPVAGRKAVQLYEKRRTAAVRGAEIAKQTDSYNHETSVGGNQALPVPEPQPQPQVIPTSATQSAPAAAPVPPAAMQQVPPTAKPKPTAEQVPAPQPASQTPVPEGDISAGNHAAPVCDIYGCCVFTRSDGSHFKSPQCAE